MDVRLTTAFAQWTEADEVRPFGEIAHRGAARAAGLGRSPRRRQLTAHNLLGQGPDHARRLLGTTVSGIDIARDTGASAYVGDGRNRWPAAHTRDAARLFRLALESAPAGSRLHGVADLGVPFADIADAIAQRLELPTTALTADDAGAHFGFLGTLVALDNPADNALTREALDWTPTHPGLLADLQEPHYFAAAPVPRECADDSSADGEQDAVHRRLLRGAKPQPLIEAAG